ncbi:hypothetical protein P8C59_000518 [Phyllachora maydis]|uniref:BHLH domain-containing protein n=1 Tax=Phyllachora maydis TaxID=1825666 RepID=A0AAD9HW98_9PEZI|nr:hypothetical protein P8C59_000518 [Phyllachora maydis]
MSIYQRPQDSYNLQAWTRNDIVDIDFQQEAMQEPDWVLLASPSVYQPEFVAYDGRAVSRDAALLSVSPAAPTQHGVPQYPVHDGRSAWVSPAPTPTECADPMSPETLLPATAVTTPVDMPMTFSPPAEESPQVRHHSEPPRFTLRTASRKQKKKSPGWHAPASAKEDRSRRSHNEIEKKSRLHLNIKYDTLLERFQASLHRNRIDITPGGSASGAPNGEVQVNRAQLLDMTATLIDWLQARNDELEAELGWGFKSVETVAQMRRWAGMEQMEMQSRV